VPSPPTFSSFIKPSDRWKFTEVSLLFVYSENGWFYDRFKREQKESRKRNPKKEKKSKESVINSAKISEQ
jgi:hypothetical protein